MGSRIFSKKFFRLFLALTLLGFVSVSCGNGTPSDVIYYLALGNSLSVGVQPDGAGENQRTDQGYADQLFAALKADHPNLQLVKLGCPSETTASMIEGGICDYQAGSQLEEAKQFVFDHPGQIFGVTLDIGANDLIGSVCIDIENGMVDQECLQEAFFETGVNLNLILSNLFETLNGEAPLIGMNYYNPFLALFLAGQPEFAMASQGLMDIFNQQVLEANYAIFGFPVADVSEAFMSHNTSPTMIPNPMPPPDFIPVNVATICQLTWMCVQPPEGPNIHANAQGYGVIAQTFLATLNAVMAP